MLNHSPTSRWLRAMPIVFVLIWSTGFIVARYGMPYAPPMKFLAMRYALSIACFVPWIYFARVAGPSSRVQWAHLAVTGVLMHAGYLGGVWAAVKLGMGSGLVALMVGLQPVLTALWLSSTAGRGDSGSGVASAVGGGAGKGASESVSTRQWLGLLLGFAGLLLVVSTKLGHGEATALNLSLAVFALLCITIGTLYQKRFVAPCDVRAANCVQLVAALAVTLPLTLLEAEPIQFTASFGWAMAWSVLGLTVGGSSLLYLLIQRGAATAVTSLLYLVPPTTALMAWLLFSEAVTAISLAGTALTALGVWLVVRAASPMR
jgi:drug/metabolite transporter (DMT)-like permease